jgi:hypothetical protein
MMRLRTDHLPVFSIDVSSFLSGSDKMTVRAQRVKTYQNGQFRVSSTSHTQNLFS